MGGSRVHAPPTRDRASEHKNRLMWESTPPGRSPVRRSPLASAPRGSDWRSGWTCVRGAPRRSLARAGQGGDGRGRGRRRGRHEAGGRDFRRVPGAVRSGPGVPDVEPSLRWSIPTVAARFRRSFRRIAALPMGQSRGSPLRCATLRDAGAGRSWTNGWAVRRTARKPVSPAIPGVAVDRRDAVGITARP